MEFTLTYEGPLKSKGNIKDKHALRKEFHSQLLELWKYPPLKSCGPPDGHFLDDNPPEAAISIIQNVGPFRFAPLVTNKLYLIAEIDITMLRPEPIGGLVTFGGDIDNRLKTLLDSLRMPSNINEIPSGESPTDNENPFFCLLEDDNLITKIGVSTHRLLKPCNSSTHVKLLIKIRTKVSQLIFKNMGLG